MEEEDIEPTIMLGEAGEPDPNAKIGSFATISFGLDEEAGNLTMAITQIPLDLRILEQFRDQLADAMAKANMKIVIYDGVGYLAPIKSSSLILPQS